MTENLQRSKLAHSSGVSSAFFLPYQSTRGYNEVIKISSIG